MTVRFCCRYPLGHRTHKNTHMKKVLCSPLPFACTLARKWDSLKQNKTGGCFRRITSNGRFSSSFERKTLNQVELFTKNREWNKIVQLIHR